MPSIHPYKERRGEKLLQKKRITIELNLRHSTGANWLHKVSMQTTYQKILKVNVIDANLAPLSVGEPPPAAFPRPLDTNPPYARQRAEKVEVGEKGNRLTLPLS